MTVRLYHTDSYQQEFEAVVVAQQRATGIVNLQLDQSCFYPTSGGQPHDFGCINKRPVLDVIEENEKILHVLKDAHFDIGQRVHCDIDWTRRFDHMQQHTGQHILSQAFIRCLNAQTKSFYLGKKLTTIDLSCKNLRKEQIYQVEDLSNQIIFENRPIRVKFVKSNQQTDFSLRKPSQRKGQLRIVEILNFDLSACGGTHCRQTGEVGIIKIRRWERVKQHARVEFYCGWRALRDYRRKNHSVYHLSKIYSSSDTQILKNAQIQMARNQEIRKNYATLENAFLETKSTLLLKKVKRIKGIKVVCEILEENPLENISKIAQRITCMPGYVVLLAVTAKKPTLFFACSEDLSYDMSEWIKICAPCIGGRGGGHRTQAQGGGTQKNGLEQALQKALQQL